MTSSAEAGTPELVRADRELGTLVLLHSWWGRTPHFHRLAASFADAGYSTALPDIYTGETTDDPARARELRQALSDEDALGRADAALDLARSHAGGGPVGLVGFSMGAELGIRLAAARPGAIRAVVAFYGLCVPGGMAELDAPVQAHVATNDEFVTPDEVGEFAQRSITLAKDIELFSYPGTEHAFFNRTRPEAYDPEAAERAWDRTLAFLRRRMTR